MQLVTISTQSLVLDYVCPGIGVVIAAHMTASPVPAVRHVNRTKQLGDLNALPFAMMLANSIVGVLYGFLLRDFYIYFANMPGLLLGLLYVFVCYKFSKERAQDNLNHLLLAIVAVVWIVGVVNLAAVHSYAAATKLWGSLSVAILGLYYVAPLSTIYTVLSTRNASSLHWPLCLMNVVNGVLWFAYGLAINNWFVAAPNGVGALFNIVCLALCVLLPHGPRTTRLTWAHVMRRCSCLGRERPWHPMQHQAAAGPGGMEVKQEVALGGVAGAKDVTPAAGDAALHVRV